MRRIKHKPLIFSACALVTACAASAAATPIALAVQSHSTATVAVRSFPSLTEAGSTAAAMNKVYSTKLTTPVSQTSHVWSAGDFNAQEINLKKSYGFGGRDVGNMYPFSQCTWWVYIRRHQLGLPCGSYFGNARDWAVNAAAAGYVVNHIPSVGAIIVFQPGQAGADLTYGHVAVVEKVENDNSVIISETSAWKDGHIDNRHIYNANQFLFIHS